MEIRIKSFEIEIITGYTTDLGSKKQINVFVSDSNKISVAALTGLNSSGLDALDSALTVAKQIVKTGFENFKIQT
jgi:hypothetical protein